MSNAYTGLHFAKCESVTPCRKGYKFGFSDNAEFFDDSSDTFKAGKWYFLELKTTNWETYEYVSHAEVSEVTCEELQLRIRNLEQWAIKAEAAWDSLESAQKAVIAKSLGCALAGAAAGGFLIDAAGTIAAEGILGIATGGLSLLFGGALGVVSAIAWEERVAAVANEKHCIEMYNNVATNFQRFVIKSCPDQYDGLPILDPQLCSTVLRIQKIFSNYTLSNLVGSNNEPLSFNLATA